MSRFIEYAIDHARLTIATLLFLGLSTHLSALGGPRSLVSQSTWSHATTLENGLAYVDRGLAGQYARSSDSHAFGRSKFSANLHRRTHGSRDRRDSHLGRHAFAGQSLAPLASGMNEGAK